VWAGDPGTATTVAGHSISCDGMRLGANDDAFAGVSAAAVQTIVAKALLVIFVVVVVVSCRNSRARTRRNKHLNAIRREMFVSHGEQRVNNETAV